MQKKSLLSCLVCLIVMWAGAFANEVQSLLDSASAAYNSNRYEECADLYGLAFEQGVRNKNVSYNAACCCALNGDVDRAIACLYTAVELGYHNTEWLQADSDLQVLRSDARWEDLVRKCDAAGEAYLKTINRELYRLFQEDQGDRMSGSGDIDWARVVERDRQRQARVGSMLDSGNVVAADDYFHAAMIFQHGEDTAAYLKAHELALKSVELDSTNGTARWLAAAAKDRYLWHIGEPQWYGTQLHMIDDKWTIEPIDTTAVSDADRRACQVPSLSESRRRAEQMNEQGDN